VVPPSLHNRNHQSARVFRIVVENHMSRAGGREIASLVQVGVHLDLDARRPTAM